MIFTERNPFVFSVFFFNFCFFEVLQGEDADFFRME